MSPLPNPDGMVVENDAAQIAFRRTVGEKPFRCAHDPWDSYATAEELEVEPDTGLLVCPYHKDPPDR